MSAYQLAQMRRRRRARKGGGEEIPWVVALASSGRWWPSVGSRVDLFPNLARARDYIIKNSIAVRLKKNAKSAWAYSPVHTWILGNNTEPDANLPKWLGLHPSSPLNQFLPSGACQSRQFLNHGYIYIFAPCMKS